MRLEQLIHLVEVAKYKSISLAAEHNYISQPAISLSISKLEDELGAILLKRTTHGVYPTEVGEIIIKKALGILEEIKDMKQIANSSTLTGHVCVGMIPSLCNKIIPCAIADLKLRQPNIEVDLLEEESIDILQGIQSGKLEIGGVILTQEIQGKDICSEELFHDEFLIYVGKKSPLAQKRSVSLKEALNYPIVAYNNEFRNNGGISSILKNYTIPQVSFRFSNFEIIKRVISEGMAISFFPKFMAKDDTYFKSGEVIPIDINDVKLDMTVGLIWSKRFPISLAAQEFVKTLKLACHNTLLT
ncbi:LysR family transcriptional regulator [Desulfosporosinus sp. PR]|uniref:LysR family transcriptional regulator n=1 Tax=Candidatus Desulfosporosinus nitrosoreducens TaxID=3401928 RepID=UPI0027EA2C68|nr:LysR family transcriptional regulator [Desulfosporosinus sp. PR]MDQ7095171.1 LysR family transcriptional regulator [Desulfosporosinus sp. PR]